MINSALTLFIVLIACCLPCLANAQVYDPCKFHPKPALDKTLIAAATDSTKNNWGYFELELKPDINLLFSILSSKNCKVQANTFNRFMWQKAWTQTNATLLVEQRLGGMVFPDSLRKLSNDELRIQINTARNPKKTMYPTPSIQAELKTALFKNYDLGKAKQLLNSPQGWLLPGSSIISAGFKSEKPGIGQLECGIAGLKIDWLRKNQIDSLLQLAYPNLSGPHYRSINGGVHFTTRWICDISKYLKLEHSSRFFKSLFPEAKPMDIEMRNSLVFSPAKGLQTSIRQSYTMNQSLGSPADFSGEIVMGYVFLKQKGKR
jgi:hypothetical protein